MKRHEVIAQAASVLKLGVVLAAAIVILGKAPGAWACYCASGSLGDELARSDLVFTGSPVSSRDPNADAAIWSSMDPIEWTFAVESTEKGTAGDPQVISSARFDGSCGVMFRIGKRYQVFALRQDDSYTTSICSGTHELAATAPPFGGGGTTWAVFPITIGALALAGSLAIGFDHYRTTRRPASER